MTISVKQLQTEWPQLLERLAAGEDLIVVQDGHAVAKIVPAGSNGASPRRLGWAKGTITILADDDEHLKDFAEYMSPKEP